MNLLSLECSICLELISEKDLPAATLCCPCKHYHEQCIIKWLSHSNTCPTCRQHYRSIKIHNGGTVKSINVQDRILNNEAIDQIPMEFIITAGTRPGSTENESSVHSNGVCAICSSSDYRSSILNMMGCDFCGTHFHLSCLSISTDISLWYCPICDHVQNFVSAIPVLNKSRPAATALRDSSERRSLSLKAARIRAGLVLTNDQDELDDDFLYEPKGESHSPVINGGVILRQEMKATQKLTREELYSWSIFEHARSKGSLEQIQSDETGSSENAGTRKKRRRPQLVGMAPESPSFALSSSRISGLLQQMKSRENINHSILSKHEHKPNTTHKSSDCRSQKSSSSSTVDVQKSTALGDLPSSLPDQNSSPTRPQSQLTLEQKLVILRLVRSRLRPLYEFGNGNNLIASEEEFIALNKMFSRKIYSKMLDSNRDMISPNSTGLRDIVEMTVKDHFDLRPPTN